MYCYWFFFVSKINKKVNITCLCTYIHEKNTIYLLHKYYSVKANSFQKFTSYKTV